MVSVQPLFLESDIVVSCVDVNNVRVYLNDWCVRLRKSFLEIVFEQFALQVGFPERAKGDVCLREVIGFRDCSGKRQSFPRLKNGRCRVATHSDDISSISFGRSICCHQNDLFLQGKSRPRKQDTPIRCYFNMRGKKLHPELLKLLTEHPH
jgi:hypothetical protein